MGDFAKYGWIITKDLIDEGKAIGTTGPGSIGPDLLNPLEKGVGLKFRMKDDDGEIYYEGRFIESPGADASFAPLDDFGGPNAGCTSIEYKEGRIWVSL